MIMTVSYTRLYTLFMINEDRGAVLRALASHQCDHGPGSNPGVDAMCWLSLMSVVLSLAPRGFSPGTPVSPSP